MQTPYALGVGDPVRDAALEAASAPILDTFGDRVRVRADNVTRMTQWVFVQGTMRGPDGGLPDFSGTSYEGPAANGQVSNVYVALVEDRNGWKLRAHSIGPSDLSWETWPQQFSAPRELFGFRHPAT